MTQENVPHCGSTTRLLEKKASLLEWDSRGMEVLCCLGYPVNGTVVPVVFFLSSTT